MQIHVGAGAKTERAIEPYVTARDGEHGLAIDLEGYVRRFRNDAQDVGDGFLAVSRLDGIVTRPGADGRALPAGPRLDCGAAVTPEQERDVHRITVQLLAAREESVPLLARAREEKDFGLERETTLRDVRRIVKDSIPALS